MNLTAVFLPPSLNIDLDLGIKKGAELDEV